jgi:uncharacterized protein YjiK
LTVFLVVVLATAGYFGFPTEPPVQVAPLVPLTERWDLERRRDRFDLPGRLAEVSGLAATEDGRLFAHDDERGLVYRIDGEDGSVDRGFQVGETLVRDDFEGMAIAGARFFLVSSTGRLYEFREAGEGESSPVRVTDTGLSGICEVEGLAYQRSSESLVLACKTVTPEVPEVRLYRLPLSGGPVDATPIRVPWSDFEAMGHKGPVHPSAIDVDPVSGTLVLLAAREELLFELDGRGRLLDVVTLPKARHRQPEGLAVGIRGLLYIADEAGGEKARLTAYGPRLPGSR